MRRGSASPGAVPEAAETLSVNWGSTQARGCSWRAAGGAGPTVAELRETCRDSVKSGMGFGSTKILL